LAYEPVGSDAHLVFELRPGAYNDKTLIEFLSDLHDIEQRPVLLIWDGLPAHRSRRMTDWLRNQSDWFCVEQLPGYASELNPIEQAWGNLKSQELANPSSDTCDRWLWSPNADSTASAPMPNSASRSYSIQVYDCDYSPTPAIRKSCLGIAGFLRVAHDGRRGRTAVGRRREGS
jgi:putative transposase